MAKRKRKKERRLPVLLLEDLPNLGQRGEVVLVKPGYYRYLVMTKKAVLATEEKLEKELKPLLLKEKIQTGEKLAKQLKEKIEQIVLEFKHNPYTSVSREKIFKALKEKNIEISKGQIELKGRIEKKGEFEVPINLGYNIKANLKIKVV